MYSKKFLFGLFLIVSIVGSVLGIIGFQFGYIEGLKDGETTIKQTPIYYIDNRTIIYQNETIIYNNETIIENIDNRTTININKTNIWQQWLWNFHHRFKGWKCR